MSTVMKYKNPRMVYPSPRESLDKQKLRHDRWTAVVVVAVTIAMMALMVWLASLGGGGYTGNEYWYIMP